MQISGSREVHAPLFSRPMGERGSAHRASVIQIFAYAGYKRDVHGQFVLSGACGWKLSSSFWSCSSLCWLGVLARAGGFRRSRFGGLLDLLLLVGRSSSARGPDTARTRRSARPFCHHPVRTSGPRRDDAEREVATPFLFSFIWVLCKCLWEGACG